MGIVLLGKAGRAVPYGAVGEICVITEATNKADELYGMERLKTVLRSDNGILH